MLNVLAISNYRSLRNLIVPLKRLNVITGPNGSGKSSLYRALRLLADVALGHIVTSLAREGGLQSTLWAGPESISRAVRQGTYPVQRTRRKQPVSLRLGFAGDDFGYLIDLGLPKPDLTSMFGLDPEIKQEAIWHGPTLRPSTMLVERRGPVARIHGENGCNIVADSLAAFESMMTHIADPRNAPEMLVLRESIRAWRFYDHFRTDADSPARLPQIGTRTPVLGNDGSDLAAALQTINEIGDNQALGSAVADAFPGGRIEVASNSGRFTLTMEQHGMLRPLDVAELSDGTLRYLLWIAVLLTPRPPALMVLNEPETSLHPDLLGPLARLISRASERSQVIVVTHAAKLIATLTEQKECHSVVLEKQFAETFIKGMNPMTTPAWRWPAR
ncbi:MAG TPA: AAA family ATPase [Terriglobales bacterium]|jgi:predicted ATPase|nr:AAA family ATPase [Terriglobales bacterium]